MEKRLFIAVLISIAFLLGWSAIMPRFFPELAKPKKAPAAVTETADTAAAAQKAETEPPESATAPEAPLETGGAIEKPSATEATVTGEEGAPEQTPSLEPVSAPDEQEIVIDHPRYVARLTNRGAQIVSFRLKNYHDPGTDNPVELVKPRPSGQFDYPFAISSSTPAADKIINRALFAVDRESGAKSDVVTFRYRDTEGRSVEKRFEFPRDEIVFSYDIHATGLKALSVEIGPGLGKHDPTQESRFLVTGDGLVSRDGSFKVFRRAKLDEPESFEKTDYIGLADNYFVTILKPATAGESGFRAIEVPTDDPKKPDREIYASVRAEKGVAQGLAYFGPKKADLLEQYGLEATLQFGIFGFIARLLLTALVWINRFTGNYGWAIIVLTVIIKVALFPLQQKSIVSMKKMQKVQPKVNAIRDKYKKAKSDPEQRQKMNTEMMKLYQKEGINPMSGCFPMLLQLPILWAFYTLLAHAIELRGAPWILWIHDLSLKDPYYVTPIVMTVTMFIQQWMTPTTADPTQRKMFLIMPIVFGWIFKEFPSGLVLYWLVQNLLTIVQQGFMNRYWKDHPDALEQGKA